MRYKDALASVKFKKDTRFMLTGGELFLKHQFIQSTRRFYPTYQFMMYDEELEDEALNTLYSDNLFGPKIVVINRFEKMDVKRFFDVLWKNIEDIVILLVSTKAHSREVSQVLSKFVEVECLEMRDYGDDYPLWIRTVISENGFEIKEGAEIIHDRIGSSLFAIYNELRKLFIYVGERKTITQKDIEQVVSIRSVSSAYMILERLLQRDIVGVLRNFDSYCRVHDNFIELAAFFGSYLEKMYRMVVLYEMKTAPDNIAEIIGLPKFIVKTKYLPRALAMGKESLAGYLSKTIDLDANLRIFKGDKRILMESFFYQFAQ